MTEPRNLLPCWGTMRKSPSALHKAHPSMGLLAAYLRCVAYMRGDSVIEQLVATCTCKQRHIEDMHVDGVSVSEA